MGKAVILLDVCQDISERYRVEIKAFKVGPSDRYPEGVKARYVLVDVVLKVPRVLVDNHAPLGFHYHPGLPVDKKKCIELDTDDYLEALDFFRDRVKEVLRNEN